jgi:hypothetical protein
MKATTVIGGLLIVAGAATLVYRGIDYTSEDTILQIGAVKATAETEKSLLIPAWAGVVAIVAGVLVLGMGMCR